MKKIDPFIRFDLEEGEELKALTSKHPLTPEIKDGMYFISSYGRVFSMWKSDFIGKPIERKPGTTKDGYLQMPFVATNKRKQKTYKVSRLVLGYFGEPKEDYSIWEANHDDFNRINNRTDNLTWMQHEQNIEYSKDNYKKLTDEEVIDIFHRVNELGESEESVAELYGYAKSTIRVVAHGINECAERHKKLGLYYKKLNHRLTDTEVKEIYKELLKTSINNSGKTVEMLSEEYNISRVIIGTIECKGGRFKEILKDFPDIHHHKSGLSEADILNIYKTANSGIYSLRDLKRIFNISAETLLDIKFCRNSYLYLKDKFNLHPPTPSDNNKTSTDDAIQIYNMALEGMSSSEIHIKTETSVGAINNIKFCRNGFEYLTSEYGLQPIEAKRPGENRHLYDIDKNDVKEIYKKANSGRYSIQELMQKYGISQSTAYNIKAARGPYKYLNPENKLYPTKKI